MRLSRSSIRRWSTIACAVVLSSAALAACGDDNDGSSASGGTATQTTGATTGGGGRQTLAETAQESGGLSFSKAKLTADAGKVTIQLDNPGDNQLPHAIEVEGNGVEEETDTIDPGSRAAVTVDLEPGRYVFYCPVGNHRDQGMEGTLTVR